MHPRQGTFIQFSCGANQTSSVAMRTSRNSLFTKNLLRSVAEPNVPICEVFRRIADAVYQESNGQKRSLSIDGLRYHKQACLNESEHKMKNFSSDRCFLVSYSISAGLYPKNKA